MVLEVVLDGKHPMFVVAAEEVAKLLVKEALALVSGGKGDRPPFRCVGEVSLVQEVRNTVVVAAIITIVAPSSSGSPLAGYWGATGGPGASS